MSGVQKTNFTQRLPATDFSDTDAAQSYAAYGEVVSLRGKRGTPNVFIVKFATMTGEIGPFLLNRTSAEALKSYLQQEGF